MEYFWDFKSPCTDFYFLPKLYLLMTDCLVCLQLSQRTISGSLLKYLSKLQVKFTIGFEKVYTAVMVDTAFCDRWTKNLESGRTLQFFLAILQATWMMGSVSKIKLLCYSYSLLIILFHVMDLLDMLSMLCYGISLKLAFRYIIKHASTTPSVPIHLGIGLLRLDAHYSNSYDHWLWVRVTDRTINQSRFLSLIHNVLPFLVKLAITIMLGEVEGQSWEEWRMKIWRKKFFPF